MLHERYYVEKEKQEKLLSRKNVKSDFYNGVYDRYEYPVLTREHIPLTWRYDLNPETNPYFMERLGINAVMNSGAIGWIVYLICLQFDTGTVIANMIATLALTVFSRVVAALRKNPVTVYLIAGIFPLVPGAGIYYTSYYFIMNNMSEFSRYGMETIKVAGAIVLGIIFGFSLPQAWFNALQHRTKRQSSHA